MLKRVLLSLLIISVLSIGLLACAKPAPAPAPAPAPTVTITTPAPAPAPAPTVTVTAQPPAPTPTLPSVTWNITMAGQSLTDHQSQPFIKFTEAVSSRTGGKFKINATVEGELGIKRDGFARALDTGVLEGAFIASGFGETTWPHQGVMNLPYLFSNTTEAAKGQAAIRPISEREYAKTGMFILADYVWVAQVMFLNKQIADPNKLEGLKVRGWTAIMLDWIKLAGGVPNNIPSGEVYVAIQRGLLDGGITGMASGLSGSWYEVAPYMYPINFSYVITDFVFSQKAFNALPKEYQDILKQEGANFTKLFADTLKTEDTTALQQWADKKGKVIPVTDVQYTALKNNAKGLWDSWLAKAGPTAKEALDAAKKALGIT